MVGHSAGEIAAAYAASALTAAEAIAVSYHRGQVARQAEGSGGMVAVGLSREQVSELLDDKQERKVSIACENSPKNITLSGDSDALEAIAKELRLRYPGAFMKRLDVNCAYHSGLSAHSILLSS